MSNNVTVTVRNTFFTLAMPQEAVGAARRARSAPPVVGSGACAGAGANTSAAIAEQARRLEDILRGQMSLTAGRGGCHQGDLGRGKSGDQSARTTHVSETPSSAVPWSDCAEVSPCMSGNPWSAMPAESPRSVTPMAPPQRRLPAATPPPGMIASSQRRTRTEDVSGDSNQVPLDSAGLPTSVGSIAHAWGTCKPCAFVQSVLGCDFGAQCRYCHLTEAHPGQTRVRPGKSRRQRLQRAEAGIQAEVGFSGIGQDRHARPIDRQSLPAEVSWTGSGI